MKKVLFHSSFSRLKTGFGSNAREVLMYLYNTGKYEVVELANGVPYGDKAEQDTPWKCYGSLSLQDQHFKTTDEGVRRANSYGSFIIDKVIEKEKPDVYIACEDFWGTAYYDKPWFNKIPSVIWTTLDSLPIYKPAADNAHKIKNFWVWSGFAEKALHKLGHEQVKTVHGMFDTKKFFPINNEGKSKLRKAFGIAEDEIIFGFVFRNQLRKLVGTLIEGFAEFKKKNKTKSKLLLHTNFSENSWNIPLFMKEFGIENEDVLTTYYCKACKGVDVTPYRGPKSNCRACGSQGTADNANIVEGITTEQLNLIYNLMDGYIHPATSGGLEMPICEAMFAGVPAATVNYSFGEDFIKSNLVYNLNYTTYREVYSQFIKSQPSPSSISAFMQKLSRNRDEYKTIGLKGRKWALEEFNPLKTAQELEFFIDKSFHSFDFNFDKPKGNPDYPLLDIENDTEWLIDMYKHILNMEETPDSKGVQDWLSALKNGKTRQDIYNYFVDVARRENSVAQKIEITDFINKNDKQKLVYIMPESIGDCVISLNVLEALRKDYPDWEIYVCTKPQYNSVFEPFTEYVDGIIPYVGQIMDNFMFWEGGPNNEQLVDIAFMPHLLTQRIPSYCHNGLDKNTLQK